MTRGRLILTSIGAVAGLWLLWSAASHAYFTPRRELLDHIDYGRTEVARREAVIADEITQRRAMRDAAARTIAGTSEAAVSALRARLNTIGHGIGLNDLRVSTTSVKSVASPVRLAHRNDDVWKDLTRVPDFYTLGADLSGQGTYEQAVRTLEVVTAEPYIKRIEHFTLRPHRGGEVVDVSISLTTVIIPGSDPPPLPEPDTAMKTRYASVTGKNVFAAPPPPPEPAPARPEPQPQVAEHKPPPVPYGDWVVTGIVWIDEKPELWLQNRKTSESKQLRSGDEILNARVEEITLTQAVVSIEGSMFSVEIGQSLGDRRPVNQ